jgi:cation diffusion facilitator CzcD-associated flavoprotein CzcO
MREKLNYDPALCDKLIPKWILGCRRLTPGDGYLESFLLPNVSLTNSPITKITPTGLETEEESFDLDVIVCATGFDASNIPFFPVTGQAGMTLAEKWKDEPESYLSLACPDFPNWFIFTGPNATVGHGTLITSMNWSAEWMIKWLRKMATEDIKSVVPTQAATDEFVRYGDQIHATLTWSGGCSSWYKNHRVDGRVTATFPGSAILYNKMIQEFRPEDFHITY